MRKLFIILLFSIPFVSCKKLEGEGPVITETRTLSSFSAIDLRIGGNLRFEKDSNFSISIRAQENVLDIIQTYISNGKLVVKFKDGVRVRGHETPEIIVRAAFLSGIELSGSGSITVQTKLVSPQVNLELSGSGNLFVSDVQTALLDVRISGSGNIRVAAGKATKEKLRIDGSGHIDLSDVLASDGQSISNGSGEMHVWCSNTLSVNIAGSGTVYYKGQPQISSQISGSGRVLPQ